jgi:hypothetical protein
MYTAMTLASTTPKPDPHGVNIAFGPIAIAVVIIVVVVSLWKRL